MGQLRIALRAYASEGHRPDAVLSRASRFLYGVTDSVTYGSSGGRTRGRRRRPALRDLPVRRGRPGDRDAGDRPRRASGPRDTHGRRDRADAAHRGRAAARHRPGRRLPDDPARPGARRDHADLHRRADRDRRPRPRHRLATRHPRDPARAHDGDMEDLADALVQAVHGPSSHHTTGPLVDRREDDIAVLLLCRRAGVRLRRPARPYGPRAPHRADRRAGRARAGRGRPPAAAGAAARLGLRGPGRLGGPAGLRDDHERPRPHRRRRAARRRGDRRSRRRAGCGSRSPTPATTCRTSATPANWRPPGGAWC